MYSTASHICAWKRAKEAKRSDLDFLPCFPLNTAFVMRPPMSESIGISDSEETRLFLGVHFHC
jgi:hypothetical protein